MERMSFRSSTPPDTASSAHDPNHDADALAWEYEDESFVYRRTDHRTAHPTDHRAAPRADRREPPPAPPKPAGDARTLRVQQALNQALDEWWRRGVLPADELLRDGLLVLEAGHDLDESQRTLLLRTALMRRRGMVTALRYQSDAERTAVLLAEALLQPVQPLTAEELARLRQNDEHTDAWTPALVELLRAAALDAGKHAAAAAALDALSTTAPPASAPPASAPLAPPPAPLWIEGESTPPHRRRLWLRLAAAAILLAGIAGLVVWWQQRQPATMIEAPAGAYLVTLAPEGAVQTVVLAAFRIDRTEATVGDYRICYERGVCPWPAATASATRPNYLLDPAFARFPMINIDYDSATRFCRFQGKRLPTAAEWEVAAAFAPATGRMYRYPWGDEFAVQRANSAALGIGDTMQVGSFRPAGDSPLGGADMAGNVAEWTSTPFMQDGVTLYLVKGGTFGDAAEGLRTAALVPAAPRTTAKWLGVRCAADVE